MRRKGPPFPRGSFRSQALFWFAMREEGKQQVPCAKRRSSSSRSGRCGSSWVKVAGWSSCAASWRRPIRRCSKRCGVNCPGCRSCTSEAARSCRPPAAHELPWRSGPQLPLLGHSLRACALGRSRCSRCARRCALRSVMTSTTVLANLYRDGRDSLGLHSDNEPELGPLRDDIAIASISLGAARRFRAEAQARPTPDSATSSAMATCS